MTDRATEILDACQLHSDHPIIPPGTILGDGPHRESVCRPCALRAIEAAREEERRIASTIIDSLRSRLERHEPSVDLPLPVATTQGRSP